MTNSSPTFVARFADGEVTRMTTHTSLTTLDVDRGVRLSHSCLSIAEEAGADGANAANHRGPL